MGRSLLNVPHDVLLDQVVELRDHLVVADALRRALAEVGLDGEELHRRLTDVVSVARTKQTDLVFAKLEVARVAEERDAWCGAVARWGAILRVRLASFVTPHQIVVAKLVREALPRNGGRRFDPTLARLRQTLETLDLHTTTLLVDGWQPPLRQEAADLIARGATAQAQWSTATDRAAEASSALDASRGHLQRLIRETRAAGDLARVHDRRVVALPLDVLRAYEPRRPQKSESDPVPSESDPVPSESDPVPSESDPVPSESDPVPSESDPVPSESDPVPSESDPVPGTSGPGTGSRIPGTRSRIPGTDLRIPGTQSRIPGTDVRIPGTRSRIPGTDIRIPGTASHSLGGPSDPPSLGPAAPNPPDDPITVVHTVTVVRTQGSS